MKQIVKLFLGSLLLACNNIDPEKPGIYENNYSINRIDTCSLLKTAVDTALLFAQEKSGSGDIFLMSKNQLIVELPDKNSANFLCKQIIPGIVFLNKTEFCDLVVSSDSLLKSSRHIAITDFKIDSTSTVFIFIESQKSIVQKNKDSTITCDNTLIGGWEMLLSFGKGKRDSLGIKYFKHY